MSNAFRLLHHRWRQDASYQADIWWQQVRHPRRLHRREWASIAYCPERDLRRVRLWCARGGAPSYRAQRLSDLQANVDGLSSLAHHFLWFSPFLLLQQTWFFHVFSMLGGAIFSSMNLAKSQTTKSLVCSGLPPQCPGTNIQYIAQSWLYRWMFWQVYFPDFSWTFPDCPRLADSMALGFGGFFFLRRSRSSFPKTCGGLAADGHSFMATSTAAIWSKIVTVVATTCKMEHGWCGHCMALYRFVGEGEWLATCCWNGRPALRFMKVLRS